ncbi:reverse transcriptase domain-containing protein [Tanacetum coccineum]
MAPKRVAAASKEVEELRKARILREKRYQTWVANTAMVKNTDGAWRMCVDFTDINKACSKDCYSLPEIDWKVDSLSDFKLKCFLDAYKGYHQIQMAKEDKHKTAFHAPQGVYCYQKMPFGLKNAGATYKRLVDKVFESQIGRNMRAYVDDMVIKSMVEIYMMADIQETFERGAELNYPIMEKLVLALIHAARRLKRYFQEHNITVLTNKPIILLLSKPEKSERVARWAILLGEYEIEFKLRNTVKAHILADFLAETKEEDEETDLQEKQQAEQTTRWKLYTDGASSGDGSDSRLMVVSPEGTEFTYALKFEFRATNNEAELKPS